MTVMESASWRNYRGHFIIVRKTFLGLRRHEVGSAGQRVETFRVEVAAELHIDSVVGSKA